MMSISCGQKETIKEWMNDESKKLMHIDLMRSNFNLLV